MTIECTLNISGIDPEQSNKAVLRSYNETSNPKYLKKHQQKINKTFKKKLTHNMNQFQIPSSLEQTFSIDFKNDGIYFISSSLNALKYEFGSGQIPPKRFIEPTVVETANEVSNILITDAVNLYKQYSG